MAKKKAAAPQKEIVVKMDKPKKAPSFRIGDIGQDIKALQKSLGLPETGIYDKATMEAETK